MYDQDCMYCAENEHLQSLMLPVCEVDGFRLYLFRDQTYPGRCIVAFRDHKRKLSELTVGETADYFACIRRVAQMLDELFHPEQVNIAMFGDKVRHLHCHLVPKYVGGTDFGGMFQMSPAPAKLLTQPEYEAIIASMKDYFAKK
jgi:ATP adenylyltransferase